jgi:hypothetical protein
LKKKNISIIAIIILFIITFHLFTFFIDLYQISKNKKPIFVIPLIYVKDGGTTIYFGFGYQVIYWYYLDTIIKNGKEINGYKRGYEIHHLFKLKYIPFITSDFEPDKETQLKFIRH